MAVGSGDRRYQACRSAVVARSRRRRAQAGKHLVLGTDLHRRRPVGRLWRQPTLLGPGCAGGFDGLHGPEQGLHLQPLERELDRAARHAPRTLVPDRGQDGGRADRGHQRARRNRRKLSAQPRRGAVYAGGRSERARDPRPGGHAAHDWRRPSGWPLPAPVRDAVRAHDGGGAVPRGQLVPQPARTLELLHLAGLPRHADRAALGYRGADAWRNRRLDPGHATRRLHQRPPPRRWPRPRSSTRQTPRRAGRQGRRCSSRAATTTPCSCPTARWSQSAAASE